MKYAEYSDSIKEFIFKKTKSGVENIGDDTALIDSGIVDSIALTELILYVEDCFDIVIDVETFNVKTFHSIKSIYESYGV
jgi:acyl carrier protein